MITVVTNTICAIINIGLAGYNFKRYLEIEKNRKEYEKFYNKKIEKEVDEVMRKAVLPFVKEKLIEINYEGLGKYDAEKFEKDFNELINLAINALEKEPCCNCIEFKRYAKEIGFEIDQEPCEDCVSREELKKWLDMNFSFGGALKKLEMFERIDRELPTVTPTNKKGK